MSRDLSQLVVSPQGTLLEAMRVIDAGGIEVAFVCEPHGKIIGTLTDGDVRRAILRGVALDVPAVGLAMQPHFVAVGPETSRAEVLDMMRARGISQVPVVDAAGALVGLHLLHELIGATEKPNWAVLMAGGMGTRLKPLTETVPKPMLPVAGRPILERLVMHLVGYGIREVFLSVNYLGHIVEEHFGDGSRFGCRIRYLREKQPLGTGGPLALLPEIPQRPVLVMNGDLVTQVNLDRLLEAHGQADAAATLCVRPYQMEVPFGVVDLEGARIVGIREKPAQQVLINAGIYVLEPAVLSLIRPGESLPITALVDQCLAKGMPVQAHVVDDDWIDVGRHEELARARGVNQ